MDKKEPNIMGPKSFSKDWTRKKLIPIQKGELVIPLEFAEHPTSAGNPEKHDSIDGHFKRTLLNPELLFTERVCGGL